MDLTSIGKKLTDATTALAKADKDLKLEMAGAAADAAGIIDPSPASDIVGAGISIARGDYWGAALSTASMVPYVGDLLAKPAKAVRATKAIAGLEKKVAALTKTVTDLKKAKKEAEAVEAAAAAAKKAELAKDADVAKNAASKQEKSAAKKEKDCEDCGGDRSKRKAPLRAVKTQKVVRGKNEVTYTLDDQGNTLSAQGSLKESFKGAKRSSSETQAQATVAATGKSGDHGGHIVGHRFMLDQGDINMFPQNGNFNMSAFKKIENDYARFTEKGHTVHFNHILGKFDTSGRPGSVKVIYKVVDKAGKSLASFKKEFLNQAGQKYIRKAGK
jgi:hypothetical protein